MFRRGRLGFRRQMVPDKPRRLSLEDLLFDDKTFGATLRMNVRTVGKHAHMTRRLASAELEDGISLVSGCLESCQLSPRGPNLRPQTDRAGAPRGVIGKVQDLDQLMEASD